MRQRERKKVASKLFLTWSWWTWRGPPHRHVSYLVSSHESQTMRRGSHSGINLSQEGSIWCEPVSVPTTLCIISRYIRGARRAADDALLNHGRLLGLRSLYTLFLLFFAIMSSLATCFAPRGPFICMHAAHISSNMLPRTTLPSKPTSDTSCQE